MTTTKKRALAATIACTLIPAAASQAATTPAKVDRDFIIKDYHGGFYEIAAAKVILAKSGTPAAARTLAHVLVTAHTKEVKELKKIADAQGVPVSSKLTNIQAAEVSQLKTLSAKNMGARFTKLEYDDHTSEIKDYGERHAKTKDSALKAYIGKWLPQYRKHAAIATAAHKKITGDPA